MNEPNLNQSNSESAKAETFGTVRNDSEEFRTLPKSSEQFGTIPKRAESFRTAAKLSERKENHTLTVREVARMFEAAGVARTERSITNWCQPNKMGFARLDYYFDPNDRKYFISPQSVEAAIQEEKAKTDKTITTSNAETVFPKGSESLQKVDKQIWEAERGRMQELEKEVLDLKITNRGKDYFIEQLQNERETFGKERQEYVEKLMSFNRKVGELETRLLQLEAPASESSRESE
jgi:hypothetical protein